MLQAHLYNIIPILLAMAEDTTSTPAWIIGLFTVQFIMQIGLAIWLVSIRHILQSERDDRNRIWQRFERGENEFKRITAKVADLEVKQAIGDGDMKTLVGKSFVTWDRFNELSDQLNKDHNEINNQIARMDERLVTVVDKLAEVTK